MWPELTAGLGLRSAAPAKWPAMNTAPAAPAASPATASSPVPPSRPAASTVPAASSRATKPSKPAALFSWTGPVGVVTVIEPENWPPTVTLPWPSTATAKP